MQLFDAADCEGGNDDAPSAGDGLLDDPGELLPVVIGFVHAVAVGGLDQQDVGFVHHRGIRQHGTTEPPEVAAEQNRPATGPDAGV